MEKEKSIELGKKHIKRLNDYYGDKFELIKPIYNIWNSNEKFVFAKYKNINCKVNYKSPHSIIKDIQEAGGGNVLRIEMKIQNYN